MSRLYFTYIYIPPVPQAGRPALYLTAVSLCGIPCIPVSILYLSILQQIIDQLYPTHCIQLYPYVSSCIWLYLTVSHIPPPQKRDINITKNTLQGQGSKGGLYACVRVLLAV